MTEQQFRELKEGDTLYDAKLSQRRRRHTFATVQVEYSHHLSELLTRSENRVRSATLISI